MNKIKIYIISVLLIILEQISKILIIKNIKNLPIIINNIFEFTYCENRGVAFSLGEGNIMLFIIINIIIILGLIIFYEKNKKEFNKIKTICYILIISGGISNLIDRIFRGYVVDFIDITSWFQFPVFNIADIFIVVGVIGFGICLIQDIMKESSSKDIQKRS